MSRRGNCHDNAVAESFFSLLKKERLKRQIYPTRAAASTDVFDYIEMFYNPVRRRGFTADLSPAEFERRHAQTGSSVSTKRRAVQNFDARMELPDSETMPGSSSYGVLVRWGSSRDNAA